MHSLCLHGSCGPQRQLNDENDHPGSWCRHQGGGLRQPGQPTRSAARHACCKRGWLIQPVWHVLLARRGLPGLVVDLLDLRSQFSARNIAGRGFSRLSGVETVSSDFHRPRHDYNRVLGLDRSHELEDVDGIASFCANQGATFQRTTLSRRRCLFSPRGRRSSARSSMLGTSARRLPSRSSCLVQA